MTDEKNTAAETYSVNYGNAVVVLPATAAERLATAEKNEIAVLIAILTHPGVTGTELPGLCGLPSSSVETAVAYWRGAGILGLTPAETEKAPKKELPEAPAEPETAKKPKKIPARQSTELPQYTMEETSQLIEDRPALRQMLDECRALLGKEFSTGEATRLLELVGQLNLDPEFVILLCSHCRKIGKKSVRYVATTAVEYFDEGITSVDALEEHLARIESRADDENELRSMLGMGSRAFGPKQKEYIRKWFEEYGYHGDVVRMAYEITADRGKENPMQYMNGIIGKWYENGLKTAEDIRTYQAQPRPGTAPQPGASSPAAGAPTAAGKSFDSGDFFAAALQRTYRGTGQKPDAKDGDPKKSN